MNIKRITIGGLIGGIVYFFLGWLIYGILLKETLAIPEDLQPLIQIPDEEMRISFMIISCLALGIFISFIFQQWAGISTFKGGLQGGAIIGAFLSIIVDTAMHSMYTFTSLPQIGIDIIANAVCVGLAGGAIGWYFDKVKG